MGITNHIESIAQLNIGQTAVVERYASQGEQSLMYRKKLLALGLTPGVELTLKKVAPMGDPLEIELRGYRLSIRKAEAEVLELRILS